MSDFIRNIGEIVWPSARSEEGIHGFYCQFDSSAYHNELFHDYAIVQPNTLHKAVVQRKAEFLAGRVVAGYTLMNLGITQFVVKNGDDRAPCWPAGIVGSITHNRDWALCVAAPSRVSKGVGIDVESVISDGLAQQIVSQIVSPAEQILLKQMEVAFSIALTAVFSAKESLYKALYPIVKTYIDFLDVQLLSCSPEQGLLVFKLLQFAAIDKVQGDTFMVRYWFMQSDTIVTFTRI